MVGDGVTPPDVTGECLCGSLVPTRAIEIERLAELGWRLFPCRPRDKTPLLKKWPGRATCELHTIRSWREKHPTCNWAVACGSDSGLWVLDVDGSDGAATVEALCQEHGGEWLSTLSVRTVVATCITNGRRSIKSGTVPEGWALVSMSGVTVDT